MTWPDSYKDRFEAAQRVIRALHTEVATKDEAEAEARTTRLREHLADNDLAAIAEYAVAIGALDKIEAILNKTLAEAQHSP